MKLLRERWKNLTHELFDGDEGLVGKCDKIKALELELKSVERALNRLIATPQTRPLSMLVSHLDILNRRRRRRRRHADLIGMANSPLPASLTEAVILVSSPPCPDCTGLKDKANEFFELSTQLLAV